jgi:hypothetical protein
MRLNEYAYERSGSTSRRVQTTSYPSATAPARVAATSAVRRCGEETGTVPFETGTVPFSLIVRAASPTAAARAAPSQPLSAMPIASNR